MPESWGEENKARREYKKDIKRESTRRIPLLKIYLQSSSTFITSLPTSPLNDPLHRAPPGVERLRAPVCSCSRKTSKAPARKAKQCGITNDVHSPNRTVKKFTGFPIFFQVGLTAQACDNTGAAASNGIWSMNGTRLVRWPVWPSNLSSGPQTCLHNEYCFIRFSLSYVVCLKIL